MCVNVMFFLSCLQLLNKGEQGEKNYTSVVPWMESLLFRQPESPSPEDQQDREVREHTALIPYQWIKMAFVRFAADLCQ